MNAKQLSFLDQHRCNVYYERGIYVATISGGWWVGHGKTKKAAIKSAVKSYEDELNAYERNEDEE